MFGRVVPPNTIVLLGSPRHTLDRMNPVGHGAVVAPVGLRAQVKPSGNGLVCHVWPEGHPLSVSTKSGEGRHTRPGTTAPATSLGEEYSPRTSSERDEYA